MGLSYDKVFWTILCDVVVITLGVDIGTDLVSLDGSFKGYNYGNLAILFL